ncbi:uncharacterized protein ACMZJ9_004712 [Mantella aurantiaca]
MNLRTEKDACTAFLRRPAGLCGQVSSSGSSENLAQEVKEASSTSEDDVIFVGHVAPLPHPQPTEYISFADVLSPATSEADPGPLAQAPPTRRHTAATACDGIKRMSPNQLYNLVAWLSNSVEDLRETMGQGPGSDDPPEFGWV